MKWVNNTSRPEVIPRHFDDLRDKFLRVLFSERRFERNFRSAKNQDEQRCAQGHSTLRCAY